MLRSRTGRACAFLLVGLLSALAAGWGVARLPPLRNIETLSYDLRMAAASGPPLDPRLVHINIDDESVRPEPEALGRWPWHRDVHARLVDLLTELGAEVIAFDVEFVEPEAPYLAPELGKDIREAVEMMVGRDGFEDVVRENIRRVRELLDAGKAEEADLLLVQLREDLKPFGEKIRLFLHEVHVRPDEEFARAITRSGRVALPISFPDHRPTTPEASPSVLASGWLIPLPDRYAIARPHLEQPIPALARGAVAFGGVDNRLHDPDRILRRSPLLYRHDDRVYAQLGLKIALDRLGRGWTMEQRLRRLVLRSEEGRAIEIPVDASGGTLLDWTRGAMPQYSYFPIYRPARDAHRADKLFGKLERLARILELERLPPWPPRGEEHYLKPSAWEAQARFLEKFVEALRAATQTVPHKQQAERAAASYVAEIRALARDRDAGMRELGDRFRGKIVLIGSTERASTDLKATSLDTALAGVFFHSNLANMVLQGRFVRPAAPWVEVTILLAGALLSSVVASLGRPAVTGPLTLGIVGAYGLAAFLFFSAWRTALPILAPVLGVALPYLLISGYRLATEERERRLMRTMFQHYLSARLVDRLIENPARAGLGGERRHVTVVMTDVHGFTSFVENNPSDLTVRTLNEYLQIITEVIIRNDGYLDKYLGDGILALFGVFGGTPEEGASAACLSALEAQEKLEKFRGWQGDLAHPLRETRIGIASGYAVVGNIGSRERFDYTAIGDAVNVAARLQVLNKKTGTRVLIEEDTARLIGEKFDMRPLGEHVLEGRLKPVRVFELLGLAVSSNILRPRKSL